jgi:hypothetical protein
VIQGGGPGVRGPTTVPAGGQISVKVGPNDTTVEVQAAGGTARPTTHPVNPNKTAQLPVPSVPPGTRLFVTVGTGLGAQTIIVEVVDTD